MMASRPNRIAEPLPRALLIAGGALQCLSFALPAVQVGARTLDGLDTFLWCLRQGAVAVLSGDGAAARALGGALVLAAGLNVVAPWWALACHDLRRTGWLLLPCVGSLCYLAGKIALQGEAHLRAGFALWCAGIALLLLSGLLRRR